VSGPVWLTTQEGICEVCNPDAVEKQGGVSPLGSNLSEFDAWSLNAAGQCIQLGRGQQKLTLQQKIDKVIMSKDTLVQDVLDVKGPNGKAVAVIADISPLYEGWPSRGGKVAAVLIDGSGRVILGTDSMGQVDGFNEAARDYLQSDEEGGEIAMRELAEFAGTKATLDWLETALPRALQGLPSSMELATLQSADGATHFDTNAIVHPRFDSMGKVVGVILEAVDITERLLDQDVTDRLLKAPGLKPAWALDMKNNVCECNASACAALNEPEDAILGTLMKEFVEDSSLADLDAGISSAKMGKKYSAKMKLKHNDSNGGHTELEMMLDICPRWDKTGNLRGVLITADLPAALRMNPDGLVIEVNDTACAMLGVYREDILGYDLMPFIEPAEKESVFGSLTDVITKRIACSQSTHFMRQTKENEWESFKVEMDASPFQIPEESGGGTGALILLQEHVRNLLYKLEYKKKDKHLSPAKGKENVSLADGGDHVGHTWERAKIAQVQLKSTKIKGALAGKARQGAALQGIEEENLSLEEKAWRALKETETDEITFNSLKKYLITHTPEERLPALQRVNAMFDKKVQAAFDDIDEAGKVDHEVFSKWWGRTEH